MSSEAEPLLYTARGDGVAVVSINDAPLNRMSLAFVERLEQVVGEIAADGGIRAWVLTAEGEVNFSVGMNLKELGSGMAAAGSLDAFFDRRLRIIRQIETMGKPSVATLYGYCLGGGLEVPLGCTFRLAAADGAHIGLPELELGSTPAWGGSARLVKCVGRANALDMILRSKKISGPEARRIGLVHEVWPLGELKQRAFELAAHLAAQPRVAVQSMLEALCDAEIRPLDELLAAERTAVKATVNSPDAREGMLAFVEKRPPRFNQSGG